MRLTKLSETSLIVHWFTVDHGLIKTVAKGARSPRSRFSGQLDLFVEAEFEWNRSSKSELHQLSEVSVTDHRFDLRKSYRDALVAGYFCQLVEMVLEDDHSEPEIYHLLQRALAWLKKKKADLRGIFHFEKELGLILGIGSKGVMSILPSYGGMPKCRDHCLDLLKEI